MRKWIVGLMLILVIALSACGAKEKTESSVSDTAEPKVSTSTESYETKTSEVEEKTIVEEKVDEEPTELERYTSYEADEISDLVNRAADEYGMRLDIAPDNGQLYINALFEFMYKKETYTKGGDCVMPLQFYEGDFLFSCVDVNNDGYDEVLLSGDDLSFAELLYPAYTFEEADVIGGINRIALSNGLLRVSDSIGITYKKATWEGVLDDLVIYPVTDDYSILKSSLGDETYSFDDFENWGCPFGEENIRDLKIEWYELNPENVVKQLGRMFN